MDPGLGVRELHKRGLTGSGIAVAMNAQLPKTERIRVVSVSDGFAKKDLDRPEIKKWVETVRGAEAEGVAVIDCSEVFPVPFNPTGAMPGRNREDPESYELWLRLQRLAPGRPDGLLLLPGDYRTTASNEGPKEYAYWGEGGRSWVAPYFAGLVALGIQANGDMSLPLLIKR